MRTAPPRFFLLALLLALLTACGGGNENAPAENLAAESDAEEQDDAIRNFPSPIQLANILKNAGADYEPELLNPEGKVTKYQTTGAQALNLGIYSADMAYANVFDKRQDALKYMSAVRRLSDKLSLDGIFTKQLETKMDKYKDQPDSLQRVYAQTLSEVKTQLRENGQGEVLNLMFVGGFVEGLFFATKIYANQPSKALANSIAEQKLNLERLLEYVTRHKDEPDFKVAYDGLVKLQKVYEEVTIEYNAPAQAAEGKTNGVIVIENSNTINISDATIAAIRNEVEPLRRAIVQ